MIQSSCSDSIRFPAFFQYTTGIFLIVSFVGQALSYGKIYLSHLVAILFLISLAFEYRFLFRILKRRPTVFLLLFAFWCFLSLSWAYSDQSLKYLFIFLFGCLQYVSVIAVSKSLKHNLIRILSILIFLEILIGIGEAFAWWRFPVSDLNPFVYSFKKSSTFFFYELKQDQLAYLKSVPTGLRWGANSFIFTIFIYLLFSVQYFQRKIFFPLVLITSFLTIAASSRLFFWAGFLAVSLLFAFKRKFKLSLISMAIPIILAYMLSSFASHLIIGQKARECLSFPEEITNKFFHFKEKVILPTASPQQVKSIANQLPSDSQRYIYWKNSWSTFRTSPIKGAGLGKSSLDPHTGQPQSTHFFLLEIMADVGIIGICLYLTFLFMPLIDAFRQNKSYFPLAIVLCLFFVVASLSLSSLIYVPIYYLSLGLIHREIYNAPHH